MYMIMKKVVFKYENDAIELTKSYNEYFVIGNEYRKIILLTNKIRNKLK